MRKKIRKFRLQLYRKRKAHIKRLKRLRRHPVMIPFGVFSGLIVVAFGAFLIANHGRPTFKPITSYIVYVSHDHVVQAVPTHEPTVGALLTKMGIHLRIGDVVEPSLTTHIVEDNFHVNVYRAVPVEIIDGSNKTFTFSAETTPRSIVQQAGITLYPEDIVTTKAVTNFAAHTSISKEVVIDRATPVNLNIYGSPALIRTHAKTVGALLVDKNIKTQKGDSVEPALNTPITPNMQVFLIHKGIKIVNVSQSIPMPVQTVQDNSLSFGTTAIRQQGSNGTRVLTYQVQTQNGVPVGRTLIQTVVTQQPVPEIVAEGQAVQIPSDITAVMAQAGIPSYDYPYVNYIVSHESGWCPTKWQGEIGYCPQYYQPLYSIYSGVGYGLGQSTPAANMIPYSTPGTSDWKTNPVAQLRWATAYADSHYGSWQAAYDAWYSRALAGHGWW